MRALESAVIWVNRLRGRVLRRRFPPENILLLLPHCLQNQQCKELLREGIQHCKGCGRCKMKELRVLADRLGVPVHVASGGREALTRSQRKDVRAILAVACTKELAEGILATFPKRVIGILNSWPHGACKDTDVDVNVVEQALLKMIREKR